MLDKRGWETPEEVKQYRVLVLVDMARSALLRLKEELQGLADIGNVTAQLLCQKKAIDKALDALIDVDGPVYMAWAPPKMELSADVFGDIFRADMSKAREITQKVNDPRVRADLERALNEIEADVLYGGIQ